MFCINPDLSGLLLFLAAENFMNDLADVKVNFLRSEMF